MKKKQQQITEQIFVGPTGTTATQAQFDQMPQSIKVFYNEGVK